MIRAALQPSLLVAADPGGASPADIGSEFVLDGQAHSIDVSELSIERFATGRLHPEQHVI